MSDWKSDLDNFFETEKQKAEKKSIQQQETTSEAQVFLQQEVLPAFNELKAALEKHGREISVHVGNDSGSMRVNFEGQQEYGFTVKTNGGRVWPEMHFREKTDGKMYRAEGMFGISSDRSTIYHVKKDDIIKHFLEDYKRTVSWPSR